MFVSASCASCWWATMTFKDHENDNVPLIFATVFTTFAMFFWILCETINTIKDDE